MDQIHGLIDPKYCCCAIPLVNAGIYAILAEQAIVGAAVGIVSLVTPDVVGASYPDFATYIFAICCWAVAICQPVGFIGVLREKTSTFKVYAWANTLAVIAAFSVGAALIITSALRHSTAVSECTTNFFSDSNSTSTTSTGIAGSVNTTQVLETEAQTLCSPFAWATIGIMGGLWILLLLAQGYFVFLTRTYSVTQVTDHKLYHSVYSQNPEAFTMSVLRSTRYNPNSVYSSAPPRQSHADDAWDARPSMDEPGPSTGYGYGKDYGAGDGAYAHHHERGYSEGGGAGEGRYDDAYGDGRASGYGEQGLPGYGHDGYEEGGGGGAYPFTQQGGGYVNHPAEAHYGRDPGQTPTANQYTYGQGVGYAENGQGGLRMPEGVQSHPAEGMFGRKSPRVVG